MKKRKNTLKSRFLVSFISLVLIMLAFVGGLISLFVRIYFINNFYKDAESVLNQAFISQYSGLSKSSEDFLSNIIYGVENQKVNLALKSDRSYIILTRDGNTLYGESALKNQDILKNENFKNALNGEFKNKPNYFGKSMIFCTPLKYKDDVLGVICVIDNMTSVNKIITSVTVLTLICCLLGLIFSVILSFKISKIITKPLEELTSAAKEMGKGNLDIKIDCNTNDEIGILSESFNNMADELKISLNNLENEKNKLSAIFFHLTDGVMVFSEEGKLYHQNNVAEKLFGFKENDEFKNIIPFIKTGIEKLKDISEKPISYIVSKDGKSLKLIFAPFETSEKNLLCIIHDVTEEENYISLQKSFTENASHELKTPLTVVKSYAQSIYDDDEMPKEIQNDFLNTIIKETDRMTSIVNDMLSLSRTEKEQVLKNEDLDIKDVILQAVKNSKIKAEQKNITFDLENIYNIKVIADESMIYRCIENIISNAIKYTKENDVVSVSMKEKGQNITINIKDNGEKIPEEYKDKIFERFFRIDKARSRKTGGTGLGLAISRESARKHGGDIYLDTSVKDGNMFVMELPKK